MTRNAPHAAPPRSIARRAAAALGAIAITLTMGACSDNGGVPPGRALVIIKGERFILETALDPASREKGLSGRETIEPDGGMIFAFPNTEPRSFWMRGCLTDIDIAYLSETGRVMTLHEMTPDPPKKPGESDFAYFNRLTRYPSRYPSRFVVEVAGGTWDRLGLEEGDVIRFDVEGLKARAR